MYIIGYILHNITYVEYIVKEYQTRAAKKYSSKCKQVSMKLNLENEKHREAYAILKDQPNKQDYIVDLIINSKNQE
ncbi:MAG: hypothetical protein [Caudoviricetes sp.]|nr:MAG: hypothetical protein [Caudoviricetes sp.]